MELTSCKIMQTMVHSSKWYSLSCYEPKVLDLLKREMCQALFYLAASTFNLLNRYLFWYDYYGAFVCKLFCPQFRFFLMELSVLCTKFGFTGEDILTVVKWVVLYFTYLCGSCETMATGSQLKIWMPSSHQRRAIWVIQFNSFEIFCIALLTK